MSAVSVAMPHPQCARPASPVSCSAARAPSCPAPPSVPDWLFEDEYQEEAIEHMLALEAACAPTLCMIDAQPEVGWDMRTYLVDFLIEVHQSYRMTSQAVLYQTVNIIDRYMSKRVVLRKHYQLLACCSLMLACKYDSAKAPMPSVHDCRALCHYAFERPAFIRMMNHILDTLEWQLGAPTIDDTLKFKCAALRDTADVAHVAQYLAQLTLYHRAFVGVPSAAVAAACHAFARSICGATTEPTVQSLQGPAAEVSQTLHQLLLSPAITSLTVLNKKHAVAAGIVQRHYAFALMYGEAPFALSRVAATSAVASTAPGLLLTAPATPMADVEVGSCTSSRQSSVSSVYSLPSLSANDTTAASTPSTPPDDSVSVRPSNALPHKVAPSCDYDYPWPPRMAQAGATFPPY